jgi:hypothetical protein
VREFRTPGSVRGAVRKGGPYRNPPWGVIQDLLLPVGLHLAAGVDLVAAQTPQCDGQGTATPLSPGVVAHAGRGQAVQTGRGRH